MNRIWRWGLEVSSADLILASAKCLTCFLQAAEDGNVL